MQTYHFNLADQRFVVDLLDHHSPAQLLPNYAPFRCDAPAVTTDADALFQLTLSADPIPTTTDNLDHVGEIDCGGCAHKIWRTHEAVSYLILIHDVDQTLACTLLTTHNFSRATCTLHGNLDAQRFGLNNALMICYSFSAAPRGLLMIHASVPCTPDAAYLFLGKSGTGKSTHTQLWLRHIPNVELLNDDNPVVRLMPDGTVRVYGTPWSGKTPCYRPIYRPLRGILKLQQAPHNAIHRLPTVSAMSEVLASCSTMPWDLSTYRHICQTVIATIAVTPVFHLQNLPNEDACRMSHKALTQP